jgi:hypothetical protein
MAGYILGLQRGSCSAARATIHNVNFFIGDLLIPLLIK